MKSIKFKTAIDNCSNVVHHCQDLNLDIKTINDTECLIELNSYKNDDEGDYLALMNGMARIVGAIDSHSITFIY